MQAISQEDVLRVALAVGVHDDAFVVGGQALNIWAEYYASRSSELSEFAPYTSKDIDYFGHQAAAKKMATALGGRIAFPPVGDSTPSTAIVTALIDGREISIDFISHVLGVLDRSLKNGVVEIVAPLQSTDGEVLISIPVMHPLHCLQSRIANVLSPATKRRDDTALRQLHAAPIILREYINEAIEDNDIKEATTCLQELFRYLRSDIHGRQVHRATSIDPIFIIKSFANDARLDPRYRRHNVASMIQTLEERRRHTP